MQSAEQTENAMHGVAPPSFLSQQGSCDAHLPHEHAFAPFQMTHLAAGTSRTVVALVIGFLVTSLKIL